MRINRPRNKVKSKLNSDVMNWQKKNNLVKSSVTERKKWVKKKYTKILKPFKYFFHSRYINRVNKRKRLIQLKKKWQSYFLFLQYYLKTKKSALKVQLKESQKKLVRTNFLRNRLDLLLSSIVVGGCKAIQKEIFLGSILVNGFQNKLYDYKVKNLDLVSYELPTHIRQRKFLRRFLARKKKLNYLLMIPKKLSFIYLNTRLNFKKNLKLWVPKIYWRYVWISKIHQTPRVLTRSRLLKTLVFNI